MAESQMQVLITSFSYYYKINVLILSLTFINIKCLLCLFYFLVDDRIGGDGICLFGPYCLLWLVSYEHCIKKDNRKKKKAKLFSKLNILNPNISQDSILKHRVKK